MRGRIDHQVAAGQRGRARVLAAPHQRPQPREQLGELERLGHVVVGAEVEAIDAVGDTVAGGQHQDRRPAAAPAQPCAGVEPVHVGQPQVEHDRVVAGVQRPPDGIRAGAGGIGRIPLLPQPAGDDLAQPGRVFDKQHPHAPSVGPARPPGRIRGPVFTVRSDAAARVFSGDQHEEREP